VLKSALKFNVDPEFAGRAFRSLKSWPTAVAAVPRRFAGVFGKTVVGGLAGWGVALLAGALLMSQAAREAPSSAPVAPTAAIEAPKAAIVAATPKVETANIATEAAPSPAAAPAPKVVAKSTVRVDTTPTGSIAKELAPKPKHKPHKKKAVDSKVQ
jgi:hypothetical protein